MAFPLDDPALAPPPDMGGDPLVAAPQLPPWTPYGVQFADLAPPPDLTSPAIPFGPQLPGQALPSDATVGPPPPPPPPASVTPPTPAPGPAPEPIVPEPMFAPAPPPPPAAPAPGELPAGTVGPPLPADELTYRKATADYAKDPQRLLADLMSGPVSPERQRYINELAQRDPQAFAELGQRLEDERQKFTAARQLEISNRDFDQQMANARMRDQAMRETQAKIAAIEAEAQRLADKKIDPSGGLSTGQKLAGILSAAVSGLVQGKTGSSQNIGLETLHATINRGIEAQKADLANQMQSLGARRSALAEQMQLTNDLYTSQETIRLASLKHADDLLKLQQQDFAPDGVRGMRIAQLRAGVAAGQAQTLRDLAQKNFDNSIKQQNADREAALATETLRHNRVGEGIDYAKLAIEKAKEGPVLSPDVLRAVMTQPGQPTPPIPRIAMSLKEYGTWLESTKKGQEAALGGREYSVGDVRPVRDADGNLIGTENSPLVNKNGQLFQAPSTDEAKKLRNQMAGINSANQLLDEMISGIKKYGGSSEFFKSPEWQTMQANKESVLFALHQAYGVEGFRPGVLEQMEHALGGQDPTKITVLSTNAVPGFEAAKKALNTHFNANLRSAGYTGEEYSPPDTKSAAELPKLSDRTLAESQPGALDQVVHGLRTSARSLITPAAPTPNAGEGPDNAPPAGPTGLSVRDTESVQTLVRKYKSGTPATKERVLTELSAAMGADRPSLRAGILGLVDGESPELYDALVKTLPRDELERLTRMKEATAAAAAQLPQPVVPIELLRAPAAAAARQE